MAEPTYHHLKVSTDQGVLVLTVTESKLQGDQLAEELRNELLEAVDHSGAQSVVLDLQPMLYLSSAGFRPFLTLRTKLKEKGARLVLCNLSGAVEEVFRITRLISTSRSSAAPFELQADVPSAVASLLRIDEPQPKTTPGPAA